MKSIGIVRRIDHLGRIVIPKEVRKTQGWETGHPMEMFMEGNRMVLQSYRKERDAEIALNELKLAQKEADNESIKATLQLAIDFIEKGTIE